MASPGDDHKDSPAMPQLKHLMMNDDEPTTNSTGGDELDKTDDPDALFNDDIPLQKSPLGDSIDALLLSWSQLLSNTGTRSPSQPPSLDHVKEVAGIVVQSFRDSCAEVNAEFAKVALEWELENGEADDEERVAALKTAISRQATLLSRAQSIIDLRSDEYFYSSIDGSTSQ